MNSQLLSLLVLFITYHAVQAGAVEDLFAAAAQCDKAGVEKALSAGADLNALNSSGQNALASTFVPVIKSQRCYRVRSVNYWLFSIGTANTNYSIRALAVPCRLITHFSLYG